MTSSELEARQRILNATIELLKEETDTAKITVRRISEKAEVGIGLINYHFHNREALLKEAVDEITGQKAQQWLNPSFSPSSIPAVDRLRNLLIETTDIIVQYPQYAEISVAYALNRSDLEVQKMILPLLREIFGMSKSEMEIRLYAMMIISSLQVGLLRYTAFQSYIGINLFDKAQRDRCINIILETIFNNKEK